MIEATLMIQITEQPYMDAAQNDEPGYLLGTCSILGVPHHIELFEVARDEEGEQHAVDPARDEQIDALIAWCNGGDNLREVVINDKAYICVITPYDE